MAVILITHDLGVVAETCGRAIVMYCGQVVENTPIERLFASPRHPYTGGLLNAIPKVRGDRLTELPIIPGRVPDLLHLPQGCRFADRCSRAAQKCRETIPRLSWSADRKAAVACYEPLSAENV